MSFVNAPIHDLLISIKNAYIARKTIIEWITYSSFKENVLNILLKHKFVQSFHIIEDGKKKFITVKVKEVSDEIQDIPVVKFYSKPSRRLYVWYNQLKIVAGGSRIGIISTHKWVMPTYEAKKQKLWWELIAEIY